MKWIGSVPEHWSVQRIRTVARILSGATPRSDVLSYWDGDITWITPEDLGALTSPYIHTSARKITHKGFHSCGTRLAPKGSIAISTRAPIGHLGILRSPACVNQGCRLLVPSMQSAFLYYCLRAARSEIRSHGAGTTFTELSRRKVADFRVPVPPAAEQSSIGRMLDHTVRRIERYLDTTRKLIALLEEQKRAIVQQAVTGKIDVRVGHPFRPYPRVRDSGVSWLGSIPAHWGVRKLKSVCSRSALYGANVPATSYTNAGVRFLRTTDITDDGRLIAGGVYVPRKLIEDYMLSDGDLLISRSGTVGRSFLYDSKKHGPCGYAGYLVRFVSDKSVLPRYLFWFTKTQAFAEFLRLSASSSTIENVNGEKYANCHIPRPPPSEQTAIVHTLDARLSPLVKKQSGAAHQIELVSEYRDRLLADVVTGKLDVRGSNRP